MKLGVKNTKGNLKKKSDAQVFAEMMGIIKKQNNGKVVLFDDEEEEVGFTSSDKAAEFITDAIDIYLADYADDKKGIHFLATNGKVITFRTGSFEYSMKMTRKRVVAKKAKTKLPPIRPMNVKQPI